MVKIDKTLYVAGAINVSKEKDENDNPIYKYDAGIVTYNTSGKYLGKYSIGKDIHHRFNSIIHDDKKLILAGMADVDNHNNDERYDSLITEFDLEKNKFNQTNIIAKDHDYVINKIITLNKNKYLVGTSKSDCSLLGCEYQPFISLYK